MFLRALTDERVVVSAILLNTLALFFLSWSEVAGDHVGFWAALDHACVIFFVVEAAAKIARFGWRGYHADGWNRFDFYIVVASLPSLLTPLVGVGVFDVSGLLILRLGRLFRAFRLLRFVPNRAHLGAGILRALRASLAVLLAVLLANFILAMGAAMLFGSIAPEYFGNPLLACYSMFQVFTVEGWHDIPNLLAARADSDAIAALSRLYFVLAVFVGGILGLSLVNAVFVDQMMVDNNDELEQRIDRLTDEIRALRDELRGR